MPCRDYESDSWSSANQDQEIRELKKQNDRLARIACKAMQELENNGIEDMLALRDDEVREWWLKHKEADRKARERKERKERRERVKAEALAKLSEEEREVLGIGKKSKQEVYVDIETLGDLLEDEYSEVYSKGGVKIYMDNRGDIHVGEDEDDDIPF